MHSAWKIVAALLLLMTACAPTGIPSLNDWLANAPQESQASDANAATPALDDTSAQHSHSGHR